MPFLAKDPLRLRESRLRHHGKQAICIRPLIRKHQLVLPSIVRKGHNNLMYTRQQAQLGLGAIVPTLG